MIQGYKQNGSIRTVWKNGRRKIATKSSDVYFALAAYICPANLSVGRKIHSEIDKSAI
jgi:hypothetical protein